MENNNSNNTTDLLNKICSGGTITPEDLGTPPANTQPTNYITEGMYHCTLNLTQMIKEISNLLCG